MVLTKSMAVYASNTTSLETRLNVSNLNHDTIDSHEVIVYALSEAMDDVLYCRD